jgi:DNA-binding SARP family transcriptional activator
VLGLRILGDLEVTVAGRHLTVARAKPRALLAVLALAEGTAVPIDRLADGIWGEATPVSARELVRLYVAQLRETLGEDAIATRPGGYALSADTETDVASFRGFVETARVAHTAGDLGAALALYDRGLELWHGRVLADTPVEGDARIEAELIDELRLTVVEERLDVALVLGQAHELVPELERQVAAHPARERLRAALMLALYRSGRQAEALAVYRDTRQHLASEYGLEPGEELRELERAILRQDPALTAPKPPTPAKARKNRRLLIVGAELVGAAAALALVIALGHSTSVKPRLVPGSLALLDGRTGKLLAAVPTPAAGTAMVAGGGLVYVGGQSHTLAEVDPGKMRVVRTIGLAAIPHALAFAGHRVWVANGFDGTITRVGSDGYVWPHLRPEPHADGRLALASTGTSLWAGSQDNVLTRIDSNGRATETARAIQPEAMLTAFGSLWVAQATRVTVRRINLGTGRNARLVPLGAPADALAASADSVWALGATRDTLWRIDPRTNSVLAAITVTEGASDVISHGDLVWVVAPATGTLQQVDPRSDAVSRTIQLGHPIGAATIVGHRLWVAIR